ncbi:MAG: hypothetical protein IKK55_01560 [Clostridia bacterium]|jgi:hypothetical protein|nr:hypothetical protein [Clostridia bacterium]
MKTLTITREEVSKLLEKLEISYERVDNDSPSIEDINNREFGVVDRTILSTETQVNDEFLKICTY